MNYFKQLISESSCHYHHNFGELSVQTLFWTKWTVHRIQTVLGSRPVFFLKCQEGLSWKLVFFQHLSKDETAISLDFYHWSYVVKISASDCMLFVNNLCHFNITCSDGEFQQIIYFLWMFQASRIYTNLEQGISGECGHSQWEKM